MYVKIFGSILDSSIWAEDHPTRILWITMLAMADAEGIVRASPSGLARRAAISGAECRKALATLEAPDLESRSQTYAGRRVERIEGGWLVLNYEKYREIRTKKQVADAERQARHRATQAKASDTSRSDGAPVADVTPGHGDIAPEAEAEVEAQKKASAPEGAANHVARATWLTPYLEQHERILGGKAAPGPMAAVMKGLEQALAARFPDATPEHIQRTVLSHQRRYLEDLVARGAAAFLSYPKFGETFGQWAKAPSKGARPTADPGKDYRAGLDEMSGGGAP